MRTTLNPVAQAIDGERQRALARLEELRPKYEDARRDFDRVSMRASLIYNEILALEAELARLKEAENVLSAERSSR